MSQTLALLGANSQICRDLIVAIGSEAHRLLLYVRDVASMQEWLCRQNLQGCASVYSYDSYDKQPHDAVINFVGVGDPSRALEMGCDILDVTYKFDELALRGLRMNPDRRYLFLSSGAVYGDVFHQPVNTDSVATFPINAVTPQHWYTLAKLHAEVRHRAFTDAPIIDLRIFNYFSRTQDLSSRFFVTDLIRAIQNGTTARVSPDFMMRDFLHPSDFHQLIECMLKAPMSNTAVDCYSAAPVDKATLLETFQKRFGLQYEFAGRNAKHTVNATGIKRHYYSLDRQARALGYIPMYSSLSGVMEEAAALVG